ncbi:MAG: S16 family serine protease, partial [Nanoarchaeota archaeon]|nr:S16 family serine protease [Nanoarchaeota archaeon]
MRPLACLLFLLLLLPTVLAQTGKIPLLAVHMEDGVTGGSTAELTLEVVPGSGRVFVDTFPLTRVDTQMSMRLAKEVACDFLEKDCRDLDFIYTIRADSPIIGGPSAGAAAAVLTVATLSSVQLPQDIAMTGTINSGGLVGPVGGL